MDHTPALSAAAKAELRDQAVRALKPVVEAYVREEVTRQLGAKAQREAVQEVVIEVLLKFYRNLSNRSGIFRNL